jgi:hypothetical protein
LIRQNNPALTDSTELSRTVVRPHHNDGARNPWLDITRHLSRALVGSMHGSQVSIEVRAVLDRVRYSGQYRASAPFTLSLGDTAAIAV